MFSLNKLLDLRFVIGVFFTVIGGLLLGQSFLSTPCVAACSINRWVGTIFLAFGILMIVMSFQKESQGVVDKIHS